MREYIPIKEVLLALNGLTVFLYTTVRTRSNVITCSVTVIMPADVSYLRFASGSPYFNYVLVRIISRWLVSYRNRVSNQYWSTQVTENNFDIFFLIA